MSKIEVVNESRRRFLQASAGLTLAIYFGRIAEAATAMGNTKTAPSKTKSPTLDPNAFVHIADDNTVTVIIKHLEMGQGTYTGLATLVADELDADWNQIKVEGAPADAKRYNNLLWGPMQGTGGSTAIANSYEQMRRAGATARFMLVEAAAQEWKVPAKTIQVSKGIISHDGSKKHATFGEFAAKAGMLPVPEYEEITLKKPKDFVYIGKRVPRKDSKPKTNGTAIYTQDIKLPGMLIALVSHAPRFGEKFKSVDSSKAKAVPGVVDVVTIPTGVAVLAKTFWAAKKGRDLLVIEWYETGAMKASTPEIFEHYKGLATAPGAVARKVGDAEKYNKLAAKHLEAEFEFPYLAHAAMEPLNCVVKLDKNSCEIWNGEQSQTTDQISIAKMLDLKPEQIKINMLYAGGSFGRRANPKSDYVLEAVSIAKAINGKAPVKLLWTREDDMRAGWYRPLFYHTLRAGLDNKNNLISWQHRLVGQSIAADTAFEGAMIKNGVDVTSVEGAANLPYSIPNMLVDLQSPTWPVPVQWWRSVGSTHTAFSTEVFIDEVAHAAGKDPFLFRMSLLKGNPRHQGVLELAAKKSGWGKPISAKKGERRGRGIAVHKAFNTYVAEVAEVTVKPDGSFHVDRVVCAVDCGMAVNPDIIHAQMEGGIGFGLTAALYGAITIKNGSVEQSNFHDYQLLRIHEMPKVEVHIVESTVNPTGVGEPGVPPIAPAVANALFAATGKRLRKLPFDTKQLKSA